MAYDYWLSARVDQLRAELDTFASQVHRDEVQVARELLQMKRNHYELSLLVLTLVDTLAAGGALDVNVLEARLEASRDAEPWSAEHPEPLTAGKPYQCTSCFRALAIAEGTMTANGMRCSACRYA